MTYEAESAAEVIRNAWFVYLDIEGDPLFAWSGTFDVELTGQSDTLLNNTWTGTSGLIEIGEIGDSEGGSPSVPITLSGVDPADTAFLEIIAEARLWQGRRAIIWHTYVNDDGLLAFDPRRVKTGRMDGLRFRQDAASAVISVDIEGFAAQSAIPLNTRYAEQREVDPDDKSQDWVYDLANKQPDIGQTGQGGQLTVPPGPPEQPRDKFEQL